MTTANLIPDLKRDEGFRATAYPDPISGGAPWTVGYGATGSGITQGTVWTEAQASANLALRVSQIAAQLTAVLPWFTSLNGPRQDVLINMAYNLGSSGLLGFHATLSAMEAGNWQAASNGMLASLWAKQVGSRATRLARQMLTGQIAGQPMNADPAPVSVASAVPPAPLAPAPVATTPIPLTPSIAQPPPIFTPAPVSTPPTIASVATPLKVGSAVAVTGLTAGATAMVGAHVVDFKELVDLAFVYLVTPVAMGVIAGLAVRLAQLLNVNLQGAFAQKVLSAAENGAALAISRANTAIDAHASITTKSQMVATGLNYLNSAVPQAVIGAGLATPEGQAKLANLVEAKIQTLTTPGVPPQ